MKKPVKTVITGSLPASFYLGDFPPESLPEKGLSKLLLGLAVHFGKNSRAFPFDQFRKHK